MTVDTQSLTAALILHRRKFRDTSLLVDLLTLDQGRVSVVAKGALGGKGSRSALLQPFQPLYVGWRGRSELKTLTTVDARGPLIPLRGKSLYCGFYINELLMHLLPVHDPNPDLFNLYEDALLDLSATSEGDLEALLRAFERQLLKHLGYELELEHETEQGDRVSDASWYRYDPELGLRLATERSLNAVQGQTLLKFQDNESLSASERLQIRNMMRSLFDYYLEGKRIRSRELFSRIKT